MSNEDVREAGGPVIKDKRVIAVAAVLLILLSGCGKHKSPSTGGAGAPQDKDGKAPGAPIKISARDNDQGRPLSEVQTELESSIRQQCGGDLCVKIKVVHKDDGF
jgi:hypothetical protein